MDESYECSCSCWTCQNGYGERHCTHCWKNHRIELELASEQQQSQGAAAEYPDPRMRKMTFVGVRLTLKSRAGK